MFKDYLYQNDWFCSKYFDFSVFAHEKKKIKTGTSPFIWWASWPTPDIPHVCLDYNCLSCNFLSDKWSSNITLDHGIPARPLMHTFTYKPLCQGVIHLLKKSATAALGHKQLREREAGCPLVPGILIPLPEPWPSEDTADDNLAPQVETQPSASVWSCRLAAIVSAKRKNSGTMSSSTKDKNGFNRKFNVAPHMGYMSAVIQQATYFFLNSLLHVMPRTCVTIITSLGICV